MGAPAKPDEIHRDDEQMNTSLVANRADPEAGPGGESEEVEDAVVDGRRQNPQELSFLYKSHDMVLLSRIGLFCTYALVAYAGYNVISSLRDAEAERHEFAWAVAGIFVCLAVPLSLHDIHMHILHYVSPLQKYYIRILWMVPIYAIESWLALRFKEQKAVLETAREAYEAWVIYSFYKLMLTFVGETDEIAQATIDALGREHAHMMFPLHKIKPWKLRGGQFLRITSVGVFQYVWIRTFFAIVGMFSEMSGKNGEGEFHVNKLYVYEVIIVNLSQSWALYCLLMFYHELIVPLADIKPFVKFVAIKCIIFLSFWQSVAISLASFFGIIEPTMDYTEEDISRGLQDFLICIEMAIAASMHKFCFSYKDFREGGPLMVHLQRCGRKKKSARDAMMEMLPIEVVNEVGGAVTARFGVVKGAIDKRIKEAEAKWTTAGSDGADQGRAVMDKAGMEKMGKDEERTDKTGEEKQGEARKVSKGSAVKSETKEGAGPEETAMASTGKTHKSGGKRKVKKDEWDDSEEADLK